MPNVPNVPGVPALTSYLAEGISLLVGDLVSLVGGSGSGYDIQLDGESAFDFDSIKRLSFQQEYAVADYKVEPGSFVSYDKVQEPAAIQLRCTSEGNLAAMSTLISEIQEAVDGTDLFDILTPQQTYTSYNPTRWRYEQTATDGVGMLIADITFIQIRESEVAAFSNTQQPGEAGQVGGGNVQAQTPTDQVSAAASASGAAEIQ